jgi:hypothetical protein
MEETSDPKSLVTANDYALPEAQVLFIRRRPPAEMANARQDQTGQASTGDGSRDGVGGGNECDVGGVIGAADDVSVDSEPRGH